MGGAKVPMVQQVSENFKISSHHKELTLGVKLLKWMLGVGIQHSSMCRAKYLYVARMSTDNWVSAVLTQWRQE